MGGDGTGNRRECGVPAPDDLRARLARALRPAAFPPPDPADRSLDAATVRAHAKLALDDADTVLRVVAECGLLLLPEDATDAMLAAGYGHHYRLDTRLGAAKARRDWRDMLNASPYYAGAFDGGPTGGA